AKPRPGEVRATYGPRRAEPITLQLRPSRATPVVLTRDVVVSTKIPRFTGGSNARSRPRVPGDRWPEEHVVAVSWIISGWVSTSSCVWRALWHGRCRIPRGGAFAAGTGRGGGPGGGGGLGWGLWGKATSGGRAVFGG